MEMTFLDVPAVPTSSPHAQKTKRLEWLCPGAAACCAAVVEKQLTAGTVRTCTGTYVRT